MPRTACVGQTSHHNRVVSEADPNAEEGYTMKLSEVSIMADQGSSGAPILNGEANFVGLLHSGAKKSMCYFVSLEDIRTALLEWGTRCCVPYFHPGFHCSLETLIISIVFHLQG
ncbi:hypothetical protein HU200_009155 [Digitaria exilis]|uniref:Serine protease n=1 Tax=Digitaria exilis TaxID=1010633 RepID=A0A835KR01_9POAL|nr:hypothetical protein HU200_009155 [Digitaria exilis]